MAVAGITPGPVQDVSSSEEVAEGWYEDEDEGDYYGEGEGDYWDEGAEGDEDDYMVEAVDPTGRMVVVGVGARGGSGKRKHSDAYPSEAERSEAERSLQTETQKAIRRLADTSPEADGPPPRVRPHTTNTTTCPD
jgi:hypothetical protein